MAPSNPLQSFHPRNLLTYISVVAATWGMFEIYHRQSLSGFAGVALCTAIVADLFDGKFAALFKGSSEIQKKVGGHLDSLADFFAFGVFPALGLLVVEHSRFGKLEYLSVAVGVGYLFAVLHRLAFYNAISANSSSFVGLPSPLGALGVAIAWRFLEGPMLLGVYVLMASLMVSPFRIVRPGALVLFGIVLLSLTVGGLHSAARYSCTT